MGDRKIKVQHFSQGAAGLAPGLAVYLPSTSLEGVNVLSSVVEAIATIVHCMGQ